MRFFNTAAPVPANDHCATPPLEHGKVDEVLALNSAMLLGDDLPAVMVQIASLGPPSPIDAVRLAP